MKDFFDHMVYERLSLSIDKGRVYELNGDTCKVKSLTGTRDYLRCSLTSKVENSMEVLKVIPKIGSVVTVGILKDNAEVLLQTSEVEAVEYTTGTTRLLINKQGYILERDGENLSKCLSDLIDEINKIVIIYGNDINRPSMNAIKKRIQTILK
ncbi:hypothetical protein Ga0061079_11723 [Apibacter mensalis]|uniref:Uncharacterized protein n=1 Tax=Apibacter mensalis TaxID=1586267 RepID=A0A0X8XYT6_9FLAO|nr:hypothetical protein [Apibacter mensalis]CVK17155.1 hypothetical protein Ga0061079_11723 [Apibacter mensalis]